MRIDNAVGNVNLSTVTSLPAPSWITEVAPVQDSDPVFSQVILTPKRLSAKIRVSKELLVASPDAERLISADLGRALSRQLNQTILYGGGALGPVGIATHPATNKVAISATPVWDQYCSARALCAAADVSLANFGEIVSPSAAQAFRNSPAVNISIWNSLERPIESNVVNS
jgi:HK97 family phage major capsid protein